MEPKVCFTGSFWKELQDRVIDKVIPYEWEALHDRVEGAPPSYCIHNFEVAAGRKSGSHSGPVFQDSDLAKFIEAAAWSLAVRPDERREEELDQLIALIGQAQDKNGYLNTAFMGDDREKRFQNLRDWHELYVAGHFIEAAVAYQMATGKDSLLRILERNVAHIRSVIGPEEDRIHGYPGHEELELALVKLYEATGKEDYLNFARYLVDERGREPNFFMEECLRYGRGKEMRGDSLSLFQAHRPVREQRTAVGHAVRAGYLYAGMADVARRTGDASLKTACQRLFEDISERQMYLTGGVGQNPNGEAFTFAYHLPNDTNYAESCAAIALVFFAHRMLKMTPDRRYADVMERTLYNGVLSGISLDGTRFFYVNSLEVWPEASQKNATLCHHDRTRRQPWFGCACCPPNIARMLLSAQQYVCTREARALYIHLYAQGVISDGALTLDMETDYPWEGTVRIRVRGNDDRILALRLPGWCAHPTVSVNGQPADVSGAVRGYLLLDRLWRDGDEILLELPMEPVWMQAHPAVRADAGKAALQRGPIVYCLEQADNGPELHRVLVDPGKPVLIGMAEGLPESIRALHTRGYRETGGGGALYEPYEARPLREVSLVLIPYFAWANREAGEMQVWSRVRPGTDGLA